MHFLSFRRESNEKEESMLTPEDWRKYDQGVPIFEKVIFVNPGPIDHKNQKRGILKRKAFGQNTHGRPLRQFHFADEILSGKPP